MDHNLSPYLSKLFIKIENFNIEICKATIAFGTNDFVSTGIYLRENALNLVNSIHEISKAKDEKEINKSINELYKSSSKIRLLLELSFRLDLISKIQHTNLIQNVLLIESKINKIFKLRIQKLTYSNASNVSNYTR